jgi:hypothetical protein
MFQTSLIPTPILFCASFEPSLAKFDPHLMELQTKIKILRWISSSVNMNAWLLFLGLAVVVVVVVVFCEDRSFCYFGKGRFFN